MKSLLNLRNFFFFNESVIDHVHFELFFVFWNDIFQYFKIPINIANIELLNIYKYWNIYRFSSEILNTIFACGIAFSEVIFNIFEYIYLKNIYI